jgi:hypothetical protein
MTARRSERPSERNRKSLPAAGNKTAGGLGRSSAPTLSRNPIGRPSKRPEGAAQKRGFEVTWPLFSENSAPSFPSDPGLAVQRLAPPSAQLAAFAGQPELPPETNRAASKKPHPAASAPEWQRAAEELVTWLTQRITRGTVEPSEQAAIARIWAAFCLGGANEAQIVRVAHIVQRAHTAIRETSGAQRDLQAAFHAAAGVLHAGLPSAIQKRMPLERTVAVVRRLRDEADAWTAIVEGTIELLGWTDYARLHAASAIRAALERSLQP